MISRPSEVEDTEGHSTDGSDSQAIGQAATIAVWFPSCHFVLQCGRLLMAVVDLTLVFKDIRNR